jgi:hypothetical protein
MKVGIFFMCPVKHVLHSYMYHWSVPYKVRGKLLLLYSSGGGGKTTTNFGVLQSWSL